MAQSDKYGDVIVEREPGNPLGEDEPVFLLRARDATSVPLLEKYLNLIFLKNSPPKHIYAVEDVIQTFREWQRRNPTLVKIPD